MTRSTSEQALPDDFERVPCLHCGGGAWTVAHIGRDHSGTSPSGTTYQIVRCNACGLHYTNPRPRAAALGRFYPPDYAPHSSGAESGDGAVCALVHRVAFGAPSVRPGGVGRIAAALVTTVRRPESLGFGVPWRGQGRLLDFGCGGGRFLRRMNGLGWNVTGVDVSDAAVSAVRSAGLRALQGTLPHAELAPGSFDVVTMRHALEHVPDPRSVLKAARQLLAPGGALVIQVPNYASWDVDYFGDAATVLDLPRHLTHFTPPTLLAMLAREGFRASSAAQAGRAGWLRKAAKRAKENGGWNGSFALGLPGAFRVAAAICRRRGRGNEIIVTAGPSK
jgi:2-polyprenyl-3-methyl-5-hydroxy-6-metoxy-1,4-benzoquinol methylase